MREILIPLTSADYRFLVALIRGPRQRVMEALVESVKESDDGDAREELCAMIEHEIRYLGSGDVPYQIRKALGVTPGVSLRTIIRDTGDVLKVPVRRLATDREMLVALAQDYATAEFARLSPQEQQRMLENLGIDRQRAVAFLKKGAGVFAAPVMIEAFGRVVVQGLIKRVVFGIIAKFIGPQLAGRLLAFLFSNVPWWVGWISPAAWTLSIGWAAISLQGPARRKTVPVMLYLGLCAMRPSRVV